MGREQKDSERGGGCMGKILALVAVLVVAGLGAAAFAILTPQDLSDVKGAGPAAAVKNGRNLDAVLSRGLKGGHPVTITEEELNLYIKRTLAMKQGGALAGRASLEDVLVRLDDHRAEIVIVRTIGGRPFTISMFVKVHQSQRPDGAVMTEILRNGGPYHRSIQRPAVGGRFGRLPVPEGFLHLVLVSFERLVGVYRDPGRGGSKEINMIEQMSKIQVEDGRLVLDPRLSQRAPR